MLVGATIWLVKIILVKVLASSFHVATYFEKLRKLSMQSSASCEVFWAVDDFEDGGRVRPDGI